MRFTTKTEYGLFCLIFMANRTEDQLVTIKEIAKRERYSLAFTEKIMQRLRAANIVSAHHGIQGGYGLARPASQITLREVVEALEGHTFDVFCEPKIRSLIVCNHFPLCGVKPVWIKTKEMLDQYYESITLAMLANNDYKEAAV